MIDTFDDFLFNMGIDIVPIERDIAKKAAEIIGCKDRAFAEITPEEI